MGIKAILGDSRDTDATVMGVSIFKAAKDGSLEPVVLRRTECYLVGQGEITLGCEREAEGAPVLLFSVTT